MTAAEQAAERLNTLTDSENARRVAVEIGLEIDEDATAALLEIYADGDPAAFTDGSFVRSDSAAGCYVAYEHAAEYIAEHE